MLVRLREHDPIDWNRASIDGSSVPSPRGGQETGPNPTDRGKLGSKRHIIVDAQGIPLVVLVSAANRHDSKMFESCVDAIPAVKGLQGRPRRRPHKLHADKGYDYPRCRSHLKKRGILSRIARRGVESSEKLGRHRWVVERTHGWFAGFGSMTTSSSVHRAAPARPSSPCSSRTASSCRHVSTRPRASPTTPCLPMKCATSTSIAWPLQVFQRHRHAAACSAWASSSVKRRLDRCCQRWLCLKRKTIHSRKTWGFSPMHSVRDVSYCQGGDIQKSPTFILTELQALCALSHFFLNVFPDFLFHGLMLFAQERDVYYGWQSHTICRASQVDGGPNTC